MREVESMHVEYFQKTINSAERGGFEPPVPEGTTVFETATIDHSAISPILLFFCSEKYDILTLQM